MIDFHPGFVLVVGMERAKLLADVLKVKLWWFYTSDTFEFVEEPVL